MFALTVVLLLLFAPPADQPSLVFELVAEFDRLAAQPLWPGFDARTTPLELYDGANTYLVRHPAPPSEFQPVPGRPGFLVYSGRHSTMRANTAIDLAGVMTATFQFDRADRGRAAVLVHECFHVFQALKHASWKANEATLFTYPVEEASALALARLEMDALSRALAAGQPACWAARALALRRQRFALLPADAAAYERGTELKEGLAQYVQGVAEGAAQVRFRSFAPEEIRLRGYTAGEAMARLLDRLDQGWKSKIAGSLDELLPAADAPACQFTEAERQAAAEQARADVAKIQRVRAGLAAILSARRGWRVSVESARPLMPNGFDPINVTRLSGTMILHKRWLRLKNDSGSLEILNHGSVTEAVGPHPLFNGVRRWTVSGLPTQPGIKQDGDRVILTTPALKLEFSPARIEIQGQTLRVLVL